MRAENGNLLRVIGMDSGVVKVQLRMLESVLRLDKQLFLQCGAVYAKHNQICEVTTSPFSYTLHQLRKQKKPVHHRALLEWLLKASHLLHSNSVVRHHFSEVTIVQGTDEKTILGFPNLATVEVVKDSTRLTEGLRVLFFVLLCFNSYSRAAMREDLREVARLTRALGAEEAKDDKINAVLKMIDNNETVLASALRER